MLVTLCATVTVSYGVLFYSFPVLSPVITKDTGWSATALMTAFSTGTLLGALTGIPVGRVLQRRGPRLVMTAGGAVGATALLVVATAPSYPVLFAGWLLAGSAGAATFYPPAFAALTHWYGDRRVWAVTTLTLVAGFSSTIFAPIIALLGEGIGWRATYAVLAGVMLVGTVPAHFLVLRLPWHPEGSGHHGPPDREALMSRTFLVLAVSGAVATLATYTSLVHLVPLLIEQGMSVELAAVGLGLSGAGQVAGRLAYPALDRRFGTNVRAAAVIGTQGVTLVALAVVPGPAALLIAVAVLCGAARGLFTLVAATLVADHWGSARYATINGVLNAPLGIAAASAPAFGAVVAGATGSYAAMFGIVGIATLAAAVLMLGAGDPAGSDQREDATPSESSSPRTRRSISSRIGRTSATSRPAGSASSQSS